MKLIRRIQFALALLREAPRRLDKLEQAVGHIQTLINQQTPSNSLWDHEYQVYSQSGEDGIIQYLIRHIPTINPVFVEFGVERYTESNTRFLLVHNDWSGLVIDGSPAHISYILQDRVAWQHSLKAIQAFITRDNINELITSQGIKGEIGLLSIDIDGNDYWVWEAINCIEPVIVICEYNSLFGPTRKVTIPYQSDFVRYSAHYSHVYYGVSIAALAHLGKQKGYVLVGGNRRGNNVFFVKQEYAAPFQSVTPAQAYVKAKFREARTKQGDLAFWDFEQSLEHIQDQWLYDIASGRTIQVKEL